MWKESSNHLRQAGQGYIIHMVDAFTLSFLAFAAAIAFFWHGLLPGCLQTRGSTIVGDIHDYVRIKMNHAGDSERANKRLT